MNNDNVPGAYEKLMDFLVDCNIASTSCPVRIQTRLNSSLANAVTYCNTCNLNGKTLADYEANKVAIDMIWEQMLNDWSNDNLYEAGK